MIAIQKVTTQSQPRIDAYHEIQQINLDQLPEDTIHQAIEALAVLLNNPQLFAVQVIESYPALASRAAIELSSLLFNVDLDRDGIVSNRKTILRALAETL